MTVTELRQIQLRQGTAAQWTASNPTLAIGEPGFENDTGKFKIGDGLTVWTSLAYQGGSGAAGGPPVTYQTVSPSGADDTANINAAITSVIAAGQANGSNYGEVWFDATKGPFTISGALQQGGTTKGNAQIPLPIIAPTAQKFTLVLRGTRDNASLPHWQQTVSNKAGAVLKSTLTGQTYSGTYGQPSVIGGPTPEQGYPQNAVAVFNNMLIVIDGIEVMAPANPTVCGVYLAGMAEANVRNLACHADQTPGTAAMPTVFTIGLVMPYNGNNDYCEIGEYSVEGWLRGCLLGEHTHARSIRAIYCSSGIAIGGPQTHAILIEHASVEACANAIEYVDLTPVAPNGGTLAYFVCNLLDIESAASPFVMSFSINDAGNKLKGRVNLCTLAGNGVGAPVNGATGVTITRIDV